MPLFYITNENTEDTFDSRDDLQNAIRIATEIAGMDKLEIQSTLSTTAKCSSNFYRPQMGECKNSWCSHPLMPKEELMLHNDWLHVSI